MTDILVLCAHGFSLGLLPGLGGSVAWLDWRCPDGRLLPLLRRSDEAAIASKDPSRLACFPMVPFANRVAESRFVAEGREITLPVNRLPNPMAIHGFGFQAPWTVADQEVAQARLVHVHADGPTPFRYRAEQAFRLAPDGLQVTLSVTNEGETLPFGIGLHPWFPRSPKTRLQFDAASIFPTDDRSLPLNPRQPKPTETFAENPIAADRPLDNCFAGWDRRARITWPETGHSVDLEAGGALRLVHVFVPTDRPVLCVEPVSHAPNVHNHPEWQDVGGLTTLATGQSLAGHLHLRPALSGR